MTVPGHHLRPWLVIGFGAETVERSFDPAIADMQAEWQEATGASDADGARGARLRGYRDVARIALVLAAEGRRDLLLGAPWRVVAPAVLLALAGVLFLGASRGGAALATAQLAFMAVASLAMLAVVAAPRRLLAASPWPWVVIGLALLGAVAAFGVSFEGARRWLELGPLRVLPGELCKPLLLLALAIHAARRGGVGGGLAIAAAFLIPLALQPDPATAIVLVSIASAVAYAASGRRAVAALGLATVAAGVTALGVASGAGARLALLAAAAREGGLTGSSSPLAEGALANARDLHTDHALAFLAARAGVLGLALLTVAVALTCVRVAAVARSAGSPLARSVATGALAMIATQAALAFAAPAAPMLVGYGGSNLVATFVALALVVRLGIGDQRGFSGAAV